MNPSITLHQQITKTNKGTVRLHLYTTAENISAKVFAIQVMPASADSHTTRFRFSHVCSPAELVEFPAQAPGDNCYFRTDDLVMLFDDPKTADLALRNVAADIAKLISEYKALQNQEPVSSETVFS